MEIANMTTEMFPNLTILPDVTTAMNVTRWPGSTIETTELLTTTSDLHTTAETPTGEVSEVMGFIAAGIAILFYGSNFVPVKKYETGDGMFFQWIVCSSVMVVGIIVQLIRDQPPFFPIAMIGGVIWEVGNICVVPIVKSVGLGLGLCIWSMINLLSGWSTGRFGLFGLNKSIPNKEAMNYVGVAMCVISAAVFAMIKNDITPVESIESEPLISEYSDTIQKTRQEYGPQSSESLYTATNNHDVLIFNKRRGSSINLPESNEEDSFIDRMSPGPKRLLGLVLCVFSGLMYGQMFTGATYIQDHIHNYKGATSNGLDYVFSCFCGIYLTSTTFFCIYIIIMKNRPKIYPKVILPAIISGIMWAVATSCWFVANKSLSIPVAFPIVTTGPSIVASLWGTIVFREIKGRRNFMILFLGFSIAITGAILAGVSKS